MADPVTLTLIGITAAAVGGGITAYGQHQSGQAQGAMYNYQAGVAKINQQIKQQDSEYFRDVGEVQAEESGMKTRAQVSQIKSNQSGSGIDVNTGSPAAVRESQIAIGQQDERIIRSNAARRAYGAEVEGVNLGAQSTVYGMSASNAKTSGDIKATGTLISTAGSVAGKWYGMGSSFGSPSGSSGGAENIVDY